MKTIVLLLLVGLAASHAAEEKSAPVSVLTPEERIQELEARIASLEKIVGTLSDELFTRDGRYMLKAGDTGAKIAQRCELTLSDLMAMNPGVRWDRLKVGQIVRVRKEGPNKAPEPTTMSVTPPAAQEPRRP